MSQPIKRAELARRLGLSKARITVLAQQGMPVTSVEAAQAWRAANVATYVRSDGANPALQQPGAPPSPASLPLEPAPMLREQLLSARLDRERADARFAMLRAAEEEGQLIRKDAVRAEHAKRLVGLREALLQIPARVAPVLAAESDQGRCHDIVQTEIHAVLRQVSGQVNAA